MSIWEHILQYLNKGQSLAFLYVIQSEGSSPGRRGFCMIVDKEGEMVGSIGGGIMEQKLVELALSRLVSNKFTPFIRKQVHRKDAEVDQSGMICSGEQTIAFYLLDASHTDIMKKIIECYDTGRNGMLELTNDGISFAEFSVMSEPLSSTILDSHAWTIRQPLGYKDRIYILGGGHVGSALSIVMRQIGFFVEIFDDRPGLNTMENNMAAHKKHYVDYASVAEYIPEGDDIYIALVSFGYRTDKAVLKSLIGRRCKYLGMMGSEEKVKTLFEELIEEGVSKILLESVRTPIGLPIHSKTPEEIAVSIASEIIQLRNQ